MEYKMTTITKFTTALLTAAALLSIAPAANAGLIALYTYDNASNLGLDSSGNGNNLSSREFRDRCHFIFHSAHFV